MLLARKIQLGKRIRLVRDTEQPWQTVVGVIPDIVQNDPSRTDPNNIAPHPVPAGSAARGVDHRANTCGAELADRGVPDRSAQYRRRSPRSLTRNRCRTKSLKSSLALSSIRNAVRRLRTLRTGVVRHRHLRGGRLLGFAAHAGDRHTHGARRAERFGASASAVADFASLPSDLAIGLGSRSA